MMVFVHLDRRIRANQWLTAVNEYNGEVAVVLVNSQPT